MATETLTYAKIQASRESLAGPLSDGIAEASRLLGGEDPLKIGRATVGADDWQTQTAPSNREHVIGRFATANVTTVDQAIDSAAGIFWNGRAHRFETEPARCDALQMRSSGDDSSLQVFSSTRLAKHVLRPLQRSTRPHSCDC